MPLSTYVTTRELWFIMTRLTLQTRCCRVSTSNVWRLLRRGKSFYDFSSTRHLLPTGNTGARHEWQKHWSTESRTNVINMTESMSLINFLLNFLSNGRQTTRVGSRKRKTTKKTQEKLFSVSWFRKISFFRLSSRRGCERGGGYNGTARKSSFEKPFAVRATLLLRFGLHSLDHAKWKHFVLSSLHAAIFLCGKTFPVNRGWMRRIRLSSNSATCGDSKLYSSFQQLDFLQT